MENLKLERRWVSRQDKAPCGTYARWTNPVETTYDEAKNYWLGDGVGIIVDPPLVAIDLDGVLANKDGQGYHHARHIVNSADSWTEASMSGKGLHILGYYHGSHRGQISNSDAFKDEYGYRVELFLQRHHVAYTGKHLKWTPDTINDITEVVDDLWQWVLSTGAEEAKPARFDEIRVYGSDDEFNFSTTDVLPLKEGSQACPWCGCSSGTNFNYNRQKDAWMCFHGGRSAGSRWQALAIEMGLITCKQAQKGALRGLLWGAVKDEAKRRGWQKNKPKIHIEENTNKIIVR